MCCAVQHADALVALCTSSESLTDLDRAAALSTAAAAAEFVGKSDLSGQLQLKRVALLVSAEASAATIGHALLDAAKALLVRSREMFWVSVTMRNDA